MKKIKFEWLVLALLAFVAALAYLPFAHKFGYFNDDWYEMYAAKVYGPQIFHAIFSIDRPLRAYVMIPLYTLFGENPLWYSLSGYLFRTLGAFTLWWMLNMLWPRARVATVLMALLFVIYPGFASQPNAIDYESHIIALALAQFSLALMVRAFQIPGLHWKRVMLLVVSALCGWAYLGLMEYYIGFELIRFLLIFMLALRTEPRWPGRVKQMLVNGLPLALIGGLFVYWRVFIFVGERKATDAGAQLSGLWVSPVETILHWGGSLLQNVVATLVVVWWAPLSQLMGSLTVTERLMGLGLGLLSLVAVYFALKGANDTDGGWRAETFWLGLASVFAGLIAVVLANRELEFPYASRYTLISSAGVVMVVVSLIYLLPWKLARALAVSVLIVAALMMQFANSVFAAQLTTSNNNFWWQVSWRIPQLEVGTTLIAHYPLVNSEEDYFVWGPANLIYFPGKLPGREVRPDVFAALPNTGTVRKVLALTGQEYDKRRTIITYTNYRHVLVLTQPTRNSCVQVIDGEQLELSPKEAKNIISIAPYSDDKYILLDQEHHTPPQIIFGPEPVRGWCYFYEKAALARQRGDWQAVVRLGDQAISQKRLAFDVIEWMPFLQGYAIAGKTERLAQIAKRLKAQPQVQAQACQILSKMSGLSADVQKQVQTLLCAPSP